MIQTESLEGIRKYGKHRILLHNVHIINSKVLPMYKNLTGMGQI